MSEFKGLRPVGAPAAFLSYAHLDDECCGGGITKFRKALEDAIRLHTGRRDIRIFQDRDITWGKSGRHVSTPRSTR